MRCRSVRKEDVSPFFNHKKKIIAGIIDWSVFYYGEERDCGAEISIGGAT
jgi:hypothetical protein